MTSKLQKWPRFFFVLWNCQFVGRRHCSSDMDMLSSFFLVSVSLDRKLISNLFFDRMAKNIAFDYALKTDDDTIINIDKVLAEVEDSIRNKRTWDWWSCFRSMWPVMDIGKWREYNLISQTYPEFPSGAGYVLRRNLIEYLSRNFDLMFKHFQGEDVSMGIWMSPIFPVKLVGRSCHWACDNEFRSYSCNVANLDVTKFSNYWKLLKKSWQWLKIIVVLRNPEAQSCSEQKQNVRSNIEATHKSCECQCIWVCLKEKPKCFCVLSYSLQKSKHRQSFTEGRDGSLWLHEDMNIQQVWKQRRRGSS